jgi:hypothetical protein
MCSIDDIEQYDSALARCEETAGNYGHTLGGTGIWSTSGYAPPFACSVGRWCG